MSKTLVIMAAGIGSRFGRGVKQLAKVGPSDELIMDYSIYDAVRAGFDHVVFVIRRDIADEFREVIGDRIANRVNVDYAYQELDQIPPVYRERFAARTKPWGTGQAVLCCRDLIDGPFLVINADDYYGREAYEIAARMLDEMTDDGPVQTLGMVSFILGRTLSDNGSVTRGICELSEEGMLLSIDETRNIVKTADGAAAQEGDSLRPLDVNSPVSMNMWVFPQSFMNTLDEHFTSFLAGLDKDDLKGEYLLPILVGELIGSGDAQVKAVSSKDQWFGMTYQEDVPAVRAELRAMVDSGVYPESLY